MNMALIVSGMSVMVLCAMAMAAAPVYDVPRLDDVKIDGQAGDWGESGFRVEILSAVDGTLKPASEFEPRFRLAWNQRGLLLLAEVADSTPFEADKIGDLWQADSLEVFISDKVGSTNYYQLVAAPGADPKHPQLRHSFNDRRARAVEVAALAGKVAGAVRPGGYVIEALLPWDNLQITPAEGMEVGLQLFANDAAAPPKSAGFAERGQPLAPGGRYRAVWFPGDDSNDPFQMHRLRLAGQASPPVTLRADGTYVDLKKTVVRVRATKDAAGKEVSLRLGAAETSTHETDGAQVTIREPGRVLAKGTLTERDGRAGADLECPMPPFGQPYGPITLLMEDKPVAVIELPDGDKARVSVKAEYVNMRRISVVVRAASELTGKTAAVIDGAKILASAELASAGNESAVTLTVPMPQIGQSYGNPAVFVGGREIAPLGLPPAESERARLLMEQKIVVEPAIFPGPDLPKARFANPLLVEELIGPHEIVTTFYDAAFNEVGKADKSGRYGAVVTVRPATGRTFQRYQTVFCTGKGPSAGRVSVQGQLTLPPELASKEQQQRQAAAMAAFARDAFAESMASGGRAGALLAGMAETSPDGPPLTVYEDAWAADRQYWVTLKRKLSGMDKKYSAPFVSPRPIEGSAATVIREGTLQQAGMKADAVERIDAICREWAANSPEAFAVCVVRHGVIVLHRAYGARDGQPMTVDTPSRMASITKLMSGQLMAMVVDQGFVGLDDPVEKFLPAFAGFDLPRAMTVRMLYTHTNGYSGHWGDDWPDLEQIAAGMYPHLELAKVHAYNGVGYALGGKIIETVSGQAIPQFYRRHLVEPLGLSHTEVTDTYGGSRSVPMDIARIGQLILNKGAYGDMRFYGEQTAMAIRPQRLTGILGEDTPFHWGIGVAPFIEPALGREAIGHGAASSALFRVLPQRDMVIVMCRNSQGPDYFIYRDRFFQAIVDSQAD